eukprot:7563392-Pyramimonas_sp.AAC.1
MSTINSSQLHACKAESCLQTARPYSGGGGFETWQTPRHGSGDAGRVRQLQVVVGRGNGRRAESIIEARGVPD